MTIRAAAKYHFDAAALLLAAAILIATLLRTFHLFFYCSGAPRDLHSFPTRRSSDLGFWSRAGARRSQEEGTGAGLTKWTSRTQDRKSTRLNSSHGSISYAVFCLK